MTFVSSKVLEYMIKKTEEEKDNNNITEERKSYLRFLSNILKLKNKMNEGKNVIKTNNGDFNNCLVKYVELNLL